MAEGPASPGDFSDLDSLPSPSTSTSSTPSQDEQGESDADREWRESLQQLELLLTMVLIPYFGKYYGRKFAYWAWGKAMTWYYPVEVVVTDPKLFKGSGVVEAATANAAL